MSWGHESRVQPGHAFPLANGQRHDADSEYKISKAYLVAAGWPSLSGLICHAAASCPHGQL